MRKHGRTINTEQCGLPNCIPIWVHYKFFRVYSEHDLPLRFYFGHWQMVFRTLSLVRFPLESVHVAKESNPNETILVLFDWASRKFWVRCQGIIFRGHFCWELFVIGPELFVSYLWKLFKHEWGSVPDASLKTTWHTSRATRDIHQRNIFTHDPKIQRRNSDAFILAIWQKKRNHHWKVVPRL